MPQVSSHHPCLPCLPACFNCPVHTHWVLSCVFLLLNKKSSTPFASDPWGLEWLGTSRTLPIENHAPLLVCFPQQLARHLHIHILCIYPALLCSGMVLLPCSDTCFSWPAWPHLLIMCSCPKCTATNHAFHYNLPASTAPITLMGQYPFLCSSFIHIPAIPWIKILGGLFGWAHYARFTLKFMLLCLFPT